MPLFEVAILEKPTKKAADEGAQERLVFGPKPIVATDEHSAAVVAARSEAIAELDPIRMEVLVRPFG